MTFLLDKTTPFDLPVVPEVYNKIDLVSKFCLDCLFFNSVRSLETFSILSKLETSLKACRLFFL